MLVKCDVIIVFNLILVFFALVLLLIYVILYLDNFNYLNFIYYVLIIKEEMFVLRAYMYIFFFFIVGWIVLVFNMDIFKILFN